MLVVHCCAQAFCSCGEWVSSLVAVLRLLTAVDSLIAGHGPLGYSGFSTAAHELGSCGPWA